MGTFSLCALFIIWLQTLITIGFIFRIRHTSNYIYLKTKHRLYSLLRYICPFISRSFDVDAIILNTIGSIIGTHLAIYIQKNNIKKIPSTTRQRGSSHSYFKLPAISVKITPSACAPASG